MKHLFTPTPPKWTLSWGPIVARWGVLSDLRTVQQNPAFHREGDVLTHTRLVCEQLIQSEKWRSIAQEDREVVFAAAVLHDIGKKATTRVDREGKLTSPGHAKLGARMARHALWELAVPFTMRERIVNLIRYHQLPYWMLERNDPERLAREVSQDLSCAHLAILTEADVRGRKAPDVGQLLEKVSLFEEFCAGLDCLHAPAAFGSSYAKFLYFRKKWNVPDVAPHEDFGSEVVLMSGLPGAGKDYWIERNLDGVPMVSLDEIRREMGIAPSKPQGKVVREAWKRARVHLRAKEPFVWNATNLSWKIRQRIIDELANYKAHIRLVYIEAPMANLFERNSAREQPVPLSVLHNLIERRWEIPDPWEAQTVEYVVD